MSREENPDTLPTPGDPTGPCPWCGRVSNIEVKPGEALAWRQVSGFGGHSFATHTSVVVRCNGCKKGTIVVTDNMGRGTHWYPAPGRGLLDRQVEKGVASAYDEGMRLPRCGPRLTSTQGRSRSRAR
jgi:hypothetical protein